MIEIEKFNESFLRVFGDRDVLQEIKDFFTFKAPGYKYHPKYKARLWDGNISLFNMQTNKLPHGLLELLKVYCQRSKVEYKLVEKNDVSPFDPEPITIEAFESFVSSLKIAKGGEAIDPYPYQVEAAFKAIKFRRMTLEMPTGSGKSLTIYLIIRWMMKEGLRTKLIVPSISLTKQMVSDFMEYSELDDSFDVDEACALLFSGQEKNFDGPVLVSTWQSLSKFVKDSKGIAILNSYDCMIVDECFDGDSRILMGDGTWEQIKNVKHGDIVQNLDCNGELKKDKVVKRHKNLRHSSSHQMYELLFDDGSKVKVTGNHNFMVANGVWKAVEDLQEGEEILSV